MASSKELLSARFVVETLRPRCPMLAACWRLRVQTIIECLKQACTGELPPNVGGNGRNWVMDPKVREAQACMHACGARAHP